MNFERNWPCEVECFDVRRLRPLKRAARESSRVPVVQRLVECECESHCVPDTSAGASQNSSIGKPL